MERGNRGKVVRYYQKKAIVIKVRQKLSISKRKACKLLDFNRQTIRYKPKKRDAEDKLRSDIICLASKYASFAYRRITSVLHDEGWEVGNKRVLRICNEEGLNVSKKQKKRYRAYINNGSCARLKALYPNHVWSYDFVHAALVSRNKYRILTIIDEFSRKCLKLAVGMRV